MRAVGGIAVGPPVNGTVEIGGPEQFRLDELMRRRLAELRDPREVITMGRLADKNILLGPADIDPPTANARFVPIVDLADRHRLRPRHDVRHVRRTRDGGTGNLALKRRACAETVAWRTKESLATSSDEVRLQVPENAKEMRRPKGANTNDMKGLIVAGGAPRLGGATRVASLLKRTR
jgi:hypothetical protein